MTVGGENQSPPFVRCLNLVFCFSFILPLPCSLACLSVPKSDQSAFRKLQLSVSPFTFTCQFVLSCLLSQRPPLPIFISCQVQVSPSMQLNIGRDFMIRFFGQNLQICHNGAFPSIDDITTRFGVVSPRTPSCHEIFYRAPSVPCHAPHSVNECCPAPPNGRLRASVGCHCKAPKATRENPHVAYGGGASRNHLRGERKGARRILFPLFDCTIAHFIFTRRCQRVDETVTF